MRFNEQTGAVKWKFDTGGERRFEAKGLHGMQPKTQTIADQFDTFLSSPVVAQGAVYFGSGDGSLYALEAASGGLALEIQDRRCRSFLPGCSSMAWSTSAVGTVIFMRSTPPRGKEKWKFHGGEDDLIHNQVGFQASPAIVDGVVYTGCRDAQLYAIDAATGKEKWKFDNQQSWVITSPAVRDGKVYFATSDSSLYHVVEAATGKSILQTGHQGLRVFLAGPDE